MAVIFALSAQPGLSTGLGTWDLVLRKLAHMTVFGLLWYLWWRALDRRSVWPAVFITVLYAISDEWHQHFVPRRHGSPIDVLIDAAGIVIAIWVVRRWTADRAGRPTRPDRGSGRS